MHKPFLRNDWKDTIYSRILTGKTLPPGKYVYSDIDYIFLAKIAEKITGLPLDQYVSKTFYEPMRLLSIGYDPLRQNHLQDITPTQSEKLFRMQLLRGFVHDPAAAMLGGGSGTCRPLQ